jgi:hypothetical protein
LSHLDSTPAGPPTTHSQFIYTVAAADAGKTLVFTCSFLPAGTYHHCRLGQIVAVVVANDQLIDDDDGGGSSTAVATVTTVATTQAQLTTQPSTAVTPWKLTDLIAATALGDATKCYYAIFDGKPRSCFISMSC